MTDRHRIWVEQAGGRIALARWGEADPHKPPALLVHGTGFVAEVWDEIARELAADYTVYGLDRRGHGASHKPPLDQYHFLDFARDVCAVVEALDLTDIFGIGHSAGATDLLLAARLLPERFSRLFVMEPTVMDPRADRAGAAALSDRAIGRRAGRAAPPGRVRQRCRGVPAVSRGAGVRGTGPKPRCGPMSRTASSR